MLCSRCARIAGSAIPADNCGGRRVAQGMNVLQDIASAASPSCKSSLDPRLALLAEDAVGMSNACNMVGDGDLDAPQHDIDAAVELFSTTGVCAPPTPTRHATAITTATATAIVTADATPACWRSLPRQVSASSETCWRLTSSTGFMRPTHGAPRRSTPA